MHIDQSIIYEILVRIMHTIVSVDLNNSFAYPVPVSRKGLARGRSSRGQAQRWSLHARRFRYKRMFDSYKMRIEVMIYIRVNPILRKVE